MQNKPELLSVPAMLAWTLLAGYYTYRSWFDADGLRNSLRRDIEKLPSWYPFKSYSLDKINSNYWLLQIRFLSTVGTVIGCASLILIIYLLMR